MPLNQPCSRRYFDTVAGRSYGSIGGWPVAPPRCPRAAMAIDSLGLPDLDKTDRLNNRLLTAMPQSALTPLKPFIRRLMLQPGFLSRCWRDNRTNLFSGFGSM